MKKWLCLLILTLLLLALGGAPLLAAADMAEAERQEYVDALTKDQQEQEQATAALERGKVILIAGGCGLLGLLAFAAIRRTRN